MARLREREIYTQAIRTMHVYRSLPMVEMTVLIILNLKTTKPGGVNLPGFYVYKF